MCWQPVDCDLSVAIPGATSAAAGRDCEESSGRAVKSARLQAAATRSSFQAAPVVQAPGVPSPSVYLPVALSPVVQSLRGCLKS